MKRGYTIELTEEEAGFLNCGICGMLVNPYPDNTSQFVCRHHHLICRACAEAASGTPHCKCGQPATPHTEIDPDGTKIAPYYAKKLVVSCEHCGWYTGAGSGALALKMHMALSTDCRLRRATALHKVTPAPLKITRTTARAATDYISVADDGTWSTCVRIDLDSPASVVTRPTPGTFRTPVSQAHLLGQDVTQLEVETPLATVCIDTNHVWLSWRVPEPLYVVLSHASAWGSHQMSYGIFANPHKLPRIAHRIPLCGAVDIYVYPIFAAVPPNPLRDRTPPEPGTCAAQVAEWPVHLRADLDEALAHALVQAPADDSDGTPPLFAPIPPRYRPLSVDSHALDVKNLYADIATLALQKIFGVPAESGLLFLIPEYPCSKFPENERAEFYLYLFDTHIRPNQQFVFCPACWNPHEICHEHGGIESHLCYDPTLILQRAVRFDFANARFISADLSVVASDREYASFCSKLTWAADIEYETLPAASRYTQDMFPKEFGLLVHRRQLEYSEWRKKRNEQGDVRALPFKPGISDKAEGEEGGDGEENGKDAELTDVIYGQIIAPSLSHPRFIGVRAEKMKEDMGFEDRIDLRCAICDRVLVDMTHENEKTILAKVAKHFDITAEWVAKGFNRVYFNFNYTSYSMPRVCARDSFAEFIKS
jgi:hypothetical protein